MPTTRAAQARYCSNPCRKRAERTRHPEKCRLWSNQANKKRWRTDAEYRERHKNRLSKWRDENRERYNTLSRKLAARAFARDPEYFRHKNRRAYRVKMYGFDPGDDPLNHYKDRFRHARALGYRSGLEVALCRGFDEAGVQYEYEPFRIPFVPKKTRFYTPDVLLPNGILIEMKGQFPTEDRTKMLAVREEYPALDIRFVFSNPNTKIGKKSKTTYADWCLSKGFKFCKASEFPRGWLTEPVNVASANAIAALRHKK